MQVIRHESCRALGCFLVRVDIKGLHDARSLSAAGRIHASLFSDGKTLPARVRPYGAAYQSKPSVSCVVEFPEISSEKAIVSIWDEGNPSNTASLHLNPPLLKWESRINYRMKHKLVNRLREGELNHHPGSFSLFFDGRFEGDKGPVWHVRIEWPSDCLDNSLLPEIFCLNEHGQVIPARILVLESQRNVSFTNYKTLDRLFVSLALEEGERRFTVVARDPSKKIPDGFCCMDHHYSAELERHYRDRIKDACSDDHSYRRWLDAHRPSQIDLALQTQRSSELEATFSIVVPCYRSNESFLHEMVDSVIHQSYPDWELILLDASPELGTVSLVASEFPDARIRYVRLKDNGGIVANTNIGIRLARNDYVAFLDHDDLLEPDALYRYAEALATPEDERPQLLYCDEDSFHKDGDYGQPSFKSDLNLDLLYSHNYITHFLVVNRALIEQIGLCKEDVSGAQDYDLTLRALSTGIKAHHVARPLYHWRIHQDSSNNGNVGSKPYALEAGRLALQRHLDQRGIAAFVDQSDEPFVYRVRYKLPSPLPLVSAIIPTRDHANLLRACVASLFEVSTYPNLEIILVENGSVLPETEKLYNQLVDEHPNSVKVIRWNDEFNYSKLINYGVSCSSGDYLLFLNNDTQVISPDFIPEMLGYLQRPEVGVVGAKLYFSDGLIQHAGVIVGAYNALAHANQFFSRNHPGYLARAIRPGNFSAVTGACQMTRRNVFDQIGGYDELFAVGFNDADFCLRAREAGYLTTFTPYAELFHYEFASRGRESVDKQKLIRWKREQARFIERWPQYFLGCDPYYNPCLERDNAYYALGL